MRPTSSAPSYPSGSNPGIAKPRDPLARRLLPFVLSPQAQSIVKDSDFTDHLPERTGFESQALRIAYALDASPANYDAALMQTFANDVKAAERLPVTFWFKSGSYILDNKALADARRLVELLKTEPYSSKSILLAGFADTKGFFALNTTLSQNRANAVLTALKSNGSASTRSKIVMKGYSELAPVACNDTTENMEINRRVEVWVY